MILTDCPEMRVIGSNRRSSVADDFGLDLKWDGSTDGGGCSQTDNPAAFGIYFSMWCPADVVNKTFCYITHKNQLGSPIGRPSVRCDCLSLTCV